MFQTISLAADQRGVARLTLCRPEKHNALDRRMIGELAEAAERLGRDASTRVVVLASEGPTFCAGGDLAWMREQMEANGTKRAEEARRLARMLQALDTLPQVLVARVQGPAYGGGVGLLSVCDVAVGVDRAVFALTETKLGLVPAAIGPYVLARIGAATARRVMLSSRPLDAQEAQGMGLLARIMPFDKLDEAVDEEVGRVLSCAPGAVADAKRLIRTLGGGIGPEAIEASITALVARWEAQEAQDGIAAFFGNYPPPWVLSSSDES